MKDIITVPLTPAYTKPNGTKVFDAAALPVPDGFNLASFITLPAGVVAGSHSHPRQEAFVCLESGVELHWIDREGKEHNAPLLNNDNEAALFIVPPHVPHAVVNTAPTPATLIEYADGPQVNVQPEAIVETV